VSKKGRGTGKKIQRKRSTSPPDRRVKKRTDATGTRGNSAIHICPGGKQSLRKTVKKKGSSELKEARLHQ